MVENIDENVGNIIKYLKEIGKYDDTIIIFLSDNGPNGNRWNNEFKERKGSTNEGGVRVPFFIQWPKKIKPGIKIKQVTSVLDVFPSLIDLIENTTNINFDGKSFKKYIENIDIFAKSFRRREGLSKNFKFKNFTNKPTLLKKKYDLIINASNAGMSHGNKINRNILRLVKKTKGVIDIVYNPLETDLLKEAKKHNIKSIGGLIMLVEQAKPSFEIWSKKDIEIDDKIYRSLISKI